MQSAIKLCKICQTAKHPRRFTVREIASDGRKKITFTDVCERCRMDKIRRDLTGRNLARAVARDKLSAAKACIIEHAITVARKEHTAKVAVRRAARLKLDSSRAKRKLNSPE